MKERQLQVLISMMFVGLSFLTEGYDRLALLIIGFMWFIASLITWRLE